MYIRIARACMRTDTTLPHISKLRFARPRFPIGARCNCPRESQHVLPCCLASRTNACACRCQEQCHAHAIYCTHAHRYYTSSHFSISLRMSTFRCARCTGVAACVVIASPQNKFRVQTCHVVVGVAPLCRFHRCFLTEITIKISNTPAAEFYVKR